MADQGSQAAMQTDINAKCTTNGAGENTGTRIRALFTNLLDTLYAAFGLARNITFTPFVSLQAGTFPGAYRDTGLTVEGAPIYKLVGAAGDPDDGLNSIFRQTPTSWVISNATGLEMYNGTGADLLTATWTNTGDGALPLPSLVGISATDVQAAVEEVAGEVAARPIVKVYDAIGAGPTITNEENQFAGVTFAVTNDSPGRFSLEATGGTPFVAGKTKVSVGVAATSDKLMCSYSIASTTNIIFRFYDNTNTEADPSTWSIYVRVYQS